MNNRQHGPEAPQTPNRSTTPQRESHLRSVLKAFSWRIVATTTTGLIAYFLLVFGETGSSSSHAAKTAISIAGIEFVLKMVFYYLHERAWQLVPRGAVRKLYHRNA